MAATVPGKAIRRAVAVLEKKWGWKAVYRGSATQDALEAAAPSIILSEIHEWREHFLHHPVENWTRADLVRQFEHRLDELIAEDDTRKEAS